MEDGDNYLDQIYCVIHKSLIRFIALVVRLGTTESAVRDVA